jgi:predicted dehydrogenase
VNSGVASLAGIDETTAATLRFGDDQVATFVTSFNAADAGSYRLVGTKGQVQVDPAYEYADGLGYALTIGDRTTRRTAPRRDQFAPELLHFSDCILHDRRPEPSGEEGLQDVRIVEALYRSAREGRVVRLPAFVDRHRPTARQRITRPGVRKPRLVKVQSAHT